jgi:hypothetical protein
MSPLEPMDTSTSTNDDENRNEQTLAETTSMVTDDEEERNETESMEGLTPHSTNFSRPSSHPVSK